MKSKKSKLTKLQPLQQGDVLLKPFPAAIPSTFKKVDAGNLGHIIAHGEQGHSHVIEEVSDAELYAEGERLLLHVLNQTTITHEEHGPITVEPGIYEIGRVVEYNYFEKMVSQVRD